MMNYEDDAEKRKKENKYLIEKMMRGESFNTVSTASTWFPPRPIIEKDKEAMGRLYNLKNKLKILDGGSDEND